MYIKELAHIKVMVSLKSLLILFVMLFLVSGSVLATPSLTDIVIDTPSGGFFLNENINLSLITNASTYSVDWLFESSSLADMHLSYDSPIISDITDNSISTTNNGGTMNTSVSVFGNSYYFDGNDYLNLLRSEIAIGKDNLHNCSLFFHIQDS